MRLFSRPRFGLFLFTSLCVSMSHTLAMGQQVENSEANVHVLIGRLVSEVDTEAVDAAIELGYIGPYARSAVHEIVEVMGQDNPQLQYECIVALGKIGPLAHEATASITRFLTVDSFLHQSAALESLRQIGTAPPEAEAEIRRLCTDPNAAIATSAIRCLLMISDENNELVHQSIPRLVKTLSDERPEVRNEAAITLSEIGSSVVPAVTAVLSEKAYGVRLKACEILGHIGPAAAGSVPDLIGRLGDDNEVVIRAAAESLGNIHSQPETVLPALSGLLKSESGPLCIMAVQAIAEFGPTAKNSSHLILELLSDKRIMVRVAAANALGRIKDDSPAVIEALVQALSDSHGIVTVNAANALSRIGAPAVPALVRMLSLEGYQKLVVEILGEMSADSESAVPALVELLNTLNPDLKREICIALAAIGPKAGAATAAMMQILENPDAGDSRADAAYVLAHIGEKKAIPALKQILKTDRSEQVLRSAAWSIVQLEPENPDNAPLVLRHLFLAMSSDSPLVRREAISAINALGPAATTAIEALLEHASSDPDASVRAVALDGLTVLQAPASQALPVAVASLRDPDPGVRNSARGLIGHLGKDAQIVAPMLRESLRSGDQSERIVAAWALVKVDPTQGNLQEAIPVLLIGLHHPDPRIRTEVVQALGAIRTKSREVLTAIESVTDDADERVKTAAIEALAKLRALP